MYHCNLENKRQFKGINFGNQSKSLIFVLNPTNKVQLIVKANYCFVIQLCLSQTNDVSREEILCLHCTHVKLTRILIFYKKSDFVKRIILDTITAHFYK